MLTTWLLLHSHVPTYQGCLENCCTPPHPHTTSQVIYLKGSGGLELHTETLNVPFDILKSEIIDVDAVFRDEYDQTTYDLYIGCGGCVASEDPLVVSPVILNGYQPVEIEPFTQTKYHSVFPKEERKYNTRQLLNCTQNHFTIRLVDYENRTESTEIIWAPVIGLAEKFTVLELLEFPIYILRNHGDVWNQLGYTFWLWLILGTPVILYTCFKALHIQWLTRNTYRNVRQFLYGFALLGFVSAALEELTHLIYVQYGHPLEWGFWVGLFVVIGFAQGSGILFTIIVWRSMIYKSCASDPRWAPLEVLTGVSFFFLFGSGFFLGPVCIILAGLLRCKELFTTKPPTSKPRIILRK